MVSSKYNFFLNISSKEQRCLVWRNQSTIKQFNFRQQQEREAQEAEKRAKEAENLAAKEAADLAAKEAAEAEELAKKKKEEEVRMRFLNERCPTFFYVGMEFEN